MWWILDLIIVAIICLYIFLSAKRGFARTIIELVGYFLAIYLAFTFGGMLANAVYDGVVEPAIVENVTDEITVAAGSSVEDAVNDVWNSLPSYVVGLAENFNLTQDTLRNTIVQNYANGDNVTAFAQSAAETIAEPIVVPLLKAVFGLILFIILMFVVKVLAKIINKAFSIPVIGGLNKFLGGVIGLFKGSIISVVFVIVILFIMSFFENGFLCFTNENVEQSVLFNFFAGFSPFK